MAGQVEHPKVIVFQFKGGARDGEMVRSDRRENVIEAHTLWTLTLSGMVGRRFNVSAPNEPHSHRSQVRSKYEDSGQILVTCDHVDEN
jgi:hypothetical protein